MNNNAISIYESVDGKMRFYFSHSGKNLTTGVMVLEPGANLPKHNRPKAVENLTQISGKCLMTLFDNSDKPSEFELNVGEGVKMEKGQWHIHANPYSEQSITLFIAEGDITEVMDVLTKSNKKIETNRPKNLM